MKIELITKEIALQRYKETRDIAFAIAKANDTLPGYCSSPECREFVAYSGLCNLKPGEACLFIDGLPAEMLTEFELEGGRVIGKICGENMVSASIGSDILSIEHADGVIEHYKWSQAWKCWEYAGNNVKNIKLAQRGIN